MLSRLLKNITNTPIFLLIQIKVVRWTEDNGHGGKIEDIGKYRVEEEGDGR